MSNNFLITSLANEKIKFLRKLKKQTYQNYFYVEGYHLVEEAIKNKSALEVYELKEQRHIKSCHLPYFEITDDIVKSLSDTQNSQGVFALCKLASNSSINNKIIFLDNVQDPGNVGTIVRNAASFDFDKVIANVNFNNHKVIRATQGAIFKINTEKIDAKNNNEYLKNLKLQGYKIYTTILDSEAISHNQIDFVKDKIVVVFGNEAQGVSKEVEALSDYKVYIPIQFESLNVACASAIILDKIYNNK